MATPAASAAGMSSRERCAAACMSVLVAATGLRLITGGGALLWLASLALVCFVVTVWPRVALQARVFVGLAVLCSAAVFAVTGTGAGREVVESAFVQSTQFATLLASLATLRLPMRRSMLISRAAAWLVACNARSRYAALSFGSHLLSLMFSFGVVPMMGEMLRRSDFDARTDAGARQMLMAVIRGLAMTTAWSPMAISFAIVSTALPHMQPLAFMGAGLLGAALMLAGGCLLHRPIPLPPPTATDSSGAASVEGDGHAIAIIIAMAATLFGATLLLYRVSGLPFIMASAISLPCFSLAWLALERGRVEPAASAHDGGAGLPLQFFRVLTEMRSETFIFSASAFIGQAIVALVLAYAGGLSGGMPVPPLAFALVCLWLIPAVAMMSIAPTIIVLLLAQAVAHSGAGVATPVTFGCALTLGWSLAIGISPVSATLLIAGSITGCPPREIAMRWNLRYTMAAAAASGCFITALYVLRW